MAGMSRRNFVKTVALGSAGLMAPAGCAVLPVRSAAEPPRHPDFCFVHLTDMHVREKRKGHLGYQACIESVKALRPRPEFALMGGDLAFDGNYTPKPEFENQIRWYKEISDSLGIPYYNCIGNHDALGWSARRKVDADDPEIGKIMIMDRLGMERSYYSFDHKGWHFFVLDSIYPVETDNGPSQEPRIGEEQLDWLRFDLGDACGKPTVGVTHIAAFCNIGQIQGNPEMRAMNHMVVKDNKDLRLILERHSVKALLQGHSHKTEDFIFNGVRYLTSPAVSAAWWGGNWTGDPPGYTVFYCKDGELLWERRFFEWEAQLEPEDDLEREKNREWDEFQRRQQELLEQECAGQREPAAV
jgi:3',5'-cyclic AMP phosphodiesterase CpdA